ncbi:MAG: PEP-CTERM sorting domain-containing protein [Planctomycetaceae bacterium]|nr:PEP-CTERM sorting domain-containing protein [Planctomycetaceae bacterium]
MLHAVWAVLDHFSESGAVPEPLTLSLLLCGCMTLLARRRRTGG